MVLSPALRRQAAANAAAAELEGFVAMLIDALEVPEVREAIAAVVRQEKAARARRGGPSASSASEARGLKTARLAARGRQRG